MPGIDFWISFTCHYFALIAYLLFKLRPQITNSCMDCRNRHKVQAFRGLLSLRFLDSLQFNNALGFSVVL